MINYLYEVRSSKIRKSKIQLVPYSELSNYHGFRSLYGYDEDAVAYIRETNSTAGMAGMPVYSNLLLVDFDDKPEEGHAMAEALREYDWVKFDSGGRSIHLHIRISEMFGSDVPYIQKEWMRQNWPSADLSIYRTSGIYRLVGTYHEKNSGRRKQAIEVNETGKQLELKVELPAPRAPMEAKPDAELEDTLMHLLGKSVSEGTTGRNYHAFKICRLCERLGIDPFQASRFILQWNNSYCNPPLPPSSLESTIRSAYRTSER